MITTDKRYQVFVSSTYDDLQDERKEVMQALLELDCIPAGMELFPASSEDQWSLIKRVIDDCDYYILIIGGRYGSVGPDGISYTQMEFEYALKAGKPIISFIHKNPASIPTGKSEQTDEGKKKFLDGEYIPADIFLEITKRDGFEIHIRTKGTFNRHVNELDKSGCIRYCKQRGCRTPDFSGCHKAIAAYLTYLESITEK